MREFLDNLKETDPGDAAAVMAGLAKLRNSPNHRPPLSNPLGEAFPPAISTRHDPGWRTGWRGTAHE